MMWSGVLAFFLGGLAWSLLEYAIHRWLGHDARLRPNVFESEHTQHHAAGDYFAPTGKKVVVESIVDPSLLGGLRIQVEGKVLDSTLLLQLEALRGLILTAA